MNATTTGSQVMRREWRALARLLLESCAAGVFASLVLALAVFVVATQAQAAGFDASLACRDPVPTFPGSLAGASLASSASASAASIAGALFIAASAWTLVARRPRRATATGLPVIDALGALECAVRASRFVC